MGLVRGDRAGKGSLAESERMICAAMTTSKKLKRARLNKAQAASAKFEAKHKGAKLSAK